MGRQLVVAGALVAFLLVTMLGVWLGVPGETGADQVPLHLLLLVAVASFFMPEKCINLP